MLQRLLRDRRLAALLLPALGACASYQPEPLVLQPVLPSAVERLTVDTAQMPLPELRAHRFDPADGLDMDEVAMLAVANNPGLRVARDELGIAQAQAFAAGLLPDPQVSLAGDFPTNGGPGNTSAVSVGLDYDLTGLMTRFLRKGAAQAQQRKVRLDLLWQEWQLVGEARLLFVRNFEQQRLLQLLNEARALLRARYEHAQQALQQGNATLEAVSADLAALQDVAGQVNALARELSRNRLDLNLLLGVAPETPLRLAGEPVLAPVDEGRIKTLLPQLARYRPDLLALQAGYRSEDLRLREAVLAQFPALNIGLTRARDTSNLYTLGFGISFSLPIFNRNQGAVAIGRATRQRLYDEFEQRLGAALSEVDAILAAHRLLEQQSADVRRAEARLQQASSNAGAALKAGNISELAYTALRASLLNKRIEQVTLEQKMLEQRVALRTLVTSALPAEGDLGEVKK